MDFPTLRDPEFGNTFTLVLNTRVHRSMNGVLREFQGAAPTWQGFSVRFIALTDTMVAALKTYFAQNQGQPVTIIDHENRTWIGLITSPHVQFTKGRSPTCDNEVSFDFEGQIQ